MQPSPSPSFTDVKRALAALALLGALAPAVTPLALAVLALAILVGLIVSDGLARRARGADDAVAVGAP
jgi:hypothetical protein